MSPAPPRATSRGPILLAVFAVAVFAVPGVARAAQYDTQLVSRATGATGVKGDNLSVAPYISSDGRYVEFLSAADNLDPAASGSAARVYVRDTQTGTTTLVSRATGAAGVDANAPASPMGISGDGRYAVFFTAAPNVDPDANALSQVYVRDLVNGTTTLVSRAAGAAGSVGNNESGSGAVSGNGSISADGRYVGFVSLATNLDPDATSGYAAVYVRDLQTGTTTLASRAGGAAGAVADSNSQFTALSADGQHVLFTSASTNLSPDDTDNSTDDYVRDTTAATTTLIDRATGSAGAKANAGSQATGISADGRYVGFESPATNLGPDDTDDTNDVFLRDTQAATTTLISRAAGATGVKGNADSSAPVLSADGRYVAYFTQATNLSPDATNGKIQVLVRDRQANTVTLVSRATGAAGAAGNDDSPDATISGDGRYVAFPSLSTNLASDDTDANFDVYRRDVLGQAPATPAGPTRPVVPRPTPPSACSTAKQTAKLSLSRATFDRRHHTISILAPISRNASGTARITLRAAGHDTTFSARVDGAHRRIRVTHAITASQARLGTGIVTIRYAGDGDTRPHTIRLRAANGVARLTATRPTLSTAGLLRAGGTVSKAAHGVVRVSLEYSNGADGRTVTITRSARISRGRWSISSQLPVALALQIALRCGTVDSSIQFTGYLHRRLRGEQRFLQVLPAR